VDVNDPVLKIHRMKLCRLLDNIVCECNERYFTYFNIIKEEQVGEKERERGRGGRMSEEGESNYQYITEVVNVIWHKRDKERTR
jgi:hypothetical protein